MKQACIQEDPLVFGFSKLEHVVAIEVPDDDVKVTIFQRHGDKVETSSSSYHPFLVTTGKLAHDCPAKAARKTLSGEAPLDTLMLFENLAAYQDACRWLKQETGIASGSPAAPYLLVSDLAQQVMLQSGVTMFKGMAFEDLLRMQIDIECVTTEGYDFCNAEREGDQIVAIAMSDSSGWVEVLSGCLMDEAALLERFVELVRERDPDVIEGHNLFNFDLPYLAARAKRHKIPLRLGRDGQTPTIRQSRFSVGERTFSFSRFHLFGRHVVDTYFLAQAYDVTHRSLDGAGLKSVAVHFGVAADDRTYIAGEDISEAFRSDPERLMDYVRDDVVETRSVADVLSRSVFSQTQMLPLRYQDAAVRGATVKIDALMLREYLRNDLSLPIPAAGRPFSGGYADVFLEGVIRNVHHCDVRSLYPSLMLQHQLGPNSDHGGVFLRLLETLRSFRLNAKASMREATDANQRQEADAFQSTFKVLINSFYGYLGFSQARFNDVDAADRVTREGRELLTRMVLWLEEHDARPIEIDTDGIYYQPPKDHDQPERVAAFRDEFSKSLPEGIEIEFDGEFEAMFSYKMKNYALLDYDGEMIIKGAALKSRGMEPFLRDFTRQLIRLRLEGREEELPDLKASFDRSLEDHQFPFESLARAETLTDAPSVYARKRDQQGASRRAAYELALASGRDYRAGDSVAYYVTGTRKNVAVHENCRLVKEADPLQRDENVAYYRGKLDSLYDKLKGNLPEQDQRQGELF